MKVINTNNIEKWMFDYFEGNLSFHEKIELENFIAENPAYQVDFEAWEGSYLVEEPVFYANTNALIKKGFFEDKKMLILFFMLIGTGVLLRMIMPNETFNNQLANSKKANKITNEIKVGAKQSEFYSDKNKGDNTDVNVANSSVYSAYTSNLAGSVLKANKYSVTSDESNVKEYLAQKNITQNTKVTNSIVANNETSLATTTTNHSENFLMSGGVRIDAKLYIYTDKSISSSIINTDIENNFTDYEQQSEEENEYKGGIVEYKKKKSSFSSYKSKTLSKSLGRMLSKDLMLTVYNNRLTLKSNQMSLFANSSFVGKAQASRLQANFESLSFYNQKDFNLSFDTKLKGVNAGVGIMASSISDVLLSKQQVDFAYGQTFNLGFLKVTPSVKAGVNQTQVNWDRVGVSGLSTSVSDSVNNNSSFGYQLAPGVLFELPFVYAGLQINDLYSSKSKFVNNYKTLELNKNESYSIVLGTDYLKSLGNKFVVSPQLYVDFYTDSRKPKLTFSTTMQYNKALFGVGYTNDKTFRGVVGVDLGNLRVAYNAQLDFDVYNAVGTEGVKHELALQYIISKKTTGILLYD